MSAENKKDVVRRFVEEVMNGGDLEAADELDAPDHVNHDPKAPTVPPGGRQRAHRDVLDRFSGHPLREGEIICEGDTVAHRWTFTGTHQAR